MVYESVTTAGATSLLYLPELAGTSVRVAEAAKVGKSTKWVANGYQGGSRLPVRTSDRDFTSHDRTHEFL